MFYIHLFNILHDINVFISSHQWRFDSRSEAPQGFPKASPRVRGNPTSAPWVGG